MPQPSASVLVTEWTWKTPAMRDMAVAVCQLALSRGVMGAFSALDLPEHGSKAHGGTGIAGSIFRILSADDQRIIAPVGVHFPDGSFQQKRIRNEHGNPIGIWRLRSHARAEALLRAHHVETPTLRQEAFWPEQQQEARGA
ncbi:MAG: hypothetical protein ABIH03_03415 [Pseudomonadota bacterium]